MNNPFKVVALPSLFGWKDDKQISPWKLLFLQSNKNPCAFWSRMVYTARSDQEITGQFQGEEKTPSQQKLRSKLADRWTRANSTDSVDSLCGWPSMDRRRSNGVSFSNLSVCFVPRSREIKNETRSRQPRYSSDCEMCLPVLLIAFPFHEEKQGSDSNSRLGDRGLDW